MTICVCYSHILTHTDAHQPLIQPPPSVGLGEGFIQRAESASMAETGLGVWFTAPGVSPGVSAEPWSDPGSGSSLTEAVCSGLHFGEAVFGRREGLISAVCKPRSR